MIPLQTLPPAVRRSVPQVIITLSPQGKLQAELPFNGGRRIVQLGQGSPAQRDEGIERTLQRILEAQARSRVECGEDGSPTEQQVRHWERHSQWPDERCKFCITEGITQTSRKKKTLLHLVGDGSVQVRRIVQRGRKMTATTMKPEDIGLAGGAGQ
jgi:hypothetical protein